MIRKYRAERQMSQTQLSDALPGAPGKTILSLIENGHVLPTKETMDAICKVFDCQPTDLFNASDLSFLPSDGGGLTNGYKVMTVTVTPGIEDALKELGYTDIQEWLNEARRSLLKDLYIQRMNQHIVIE